MEGNVCIDHVHLCVKIPPKMSVAEFMGYLKGKGALMIFDKHPEYKQNKADDTFGQGDITLILLDATKNRFEHISKIKPIQICEKMA